MTTDAPQRGFWHRQWRVLWLTVLRYSSIGGEQRAASFAYYAFFALFPLLLLLASIGSYFLDPARVGNWVLNSVSAYVLVENTKHDMVTQTIRGVIKARRGVGSFAVLGLIWSSLRFFQALVHGVNRAWGTHEYTWWRLPIQNLLLVALTASALFIGMAAPPVLQRLEVLVHLQFPFAISIIAFVRFLVPSVVLFYGFSMFYKLAPRRKTTFGEVWQAAMLVTILIQFLQSAFLLYTRNVAHFNAVYGAFGSVIAVLMWIYLSGSVIILGGCFSASQAEIAGRLSYTAARAAAEKRGE
jgi:Ca2+-transporting ATPase